MLCGRTVVIAKYLLIEVTEQVKRFNTNVCSFESPLYEAPEVLQPISVYLPVNVFLGMVNDSMSVFLVQSPIGMTIIRRELRAAFDVISNECLQSVTASIFQNDSPHFAATLHQSNDGAFIFHRRTANFAALLLRAFLASLQPVNDKIAAIRGKYAGATAAATEPVFGYMADELHLMLLERRFARGSLQIPR